MILDYIYHSGFAIEAEGVTLIIDYYKDSSETELNKGIVHDRLLQRPGKLYVLASHFHPDHFNREVLTWKEQRPDIIYIFSKDILKHHRAQKEDAIYINKGEEYEDDMLRIQAFGSTDVGISFLIHLQGKSIFHAGDLNNWHWSEESTEQEIRKAEGDFLAEIKYLQAAVPAIDLVMFPVDPRLGSDFARGARQWLQYIPTRYFAPMHFPPARERAMTFGPEAERMQTRFLYIQEEGEAIARF